MGTLDECLYCILAGDILIYSQAIVVVVEQGVTLMFTVGQISVMAALLKGREHLINSSNILLTLL